MSYTAIEAMRKKNAERFHADIGPHRPPYFPGEETGTDLKSAALRFLEKRCVGLRFSSEKEKEEEETGKYLGTSLLPNQIPYNMQMDIDRLCMKNELANSLIPASRKMPTRSTMPIWRCSSVSTAAPRTW